LATIAAVGLTTGEATVVGSIEQSATDADNGTLASMSGEFIGAVISRLPDVRTADGDTHTVEIDAAWVGRVRSTCRLVREQRLSRWFWSAARADRIAD
jgi:hypothetical protein